MSFNKERWSRQSVAMNTGAYTLNDASLRNGPAIFTYASASDTIEDMTLDDTSNVYFASARFDLAAGDLIFAEANDGLVYSLRVSAVDRDAGTVTVASAPLSGVNPVETVRVSLDQAAINALAAAPQTLVAAPGNDRVIQFLGAQLVYDYSTAAYTITAGGDDLAIRYTDGSGAIVSETIETTGFIDQVVDMVQNAVPKADVIAAATAAVNQPLVLDNIGANEFTNGGGTLDVIVSYKVVPANLA